jgi:hypothetical protein
LPGHPPEGGYGKAPYRSIEKLKDAAHSGNGVANGKTAAKKPKAKSGTAVRV